MKLDRYKEIAFHVVHSPDDELVRRLNARIGRIVDWGSIRHAESLDFMNGDHDVFAIPKVMGDRYDLAEYVRSIRVLSVQEPELVFRFELDEEIQIKNGRAVENDDEL